MTLRIVRLTIDDQPVDVLEGSTILEACESLGIDTPTVCYGDTLANVDVRGLLASHRASGALATLTTYPLRSPFGVVRFDESGRVSDFEEKPALPYWINIGFILCEPEALEHLRPGSDMPAFLSSLAAEGGLYAYRHTGKHLTVNTEKERADAEVEMVEFFTYMDGQQK